MFRMKGVGPQGFGISPILANVYLHHVIDEWFSTIKKSHIKGRAGEIRYADDIVFVFQNHREAERFFKVLPLRLQKFGPEMHADKSSIIPSGRLAAERAHCEGKRIPTYKFLGFTCYWVWLDQSSGDSNLRAAQIDSQSNSED